MNRSIRRGGTGVVVLMLLLVAQLTYLQMVSADRLANDPRNVRNLIRDFSRPRGPIITEQGDVVARSVPTDDEFKYQREYPLTDLYAHVSGYQSLVVGSTGIEKEYNDKLVGRDTQLQLNSFENAIENLGKALAGEQSTGTVVLSVRKDAQEAARAALGERKGSVVALDPKTGAVLALYSNPSYDPQPLAAHDAEAVQERYTLLNLAPEQPLLPRAYRQRYAPGSTFKVVTTGTALDTGVVTPETDFPSVTEIDLPLSDKTLSNFGGESCGGTLFESFVNSCNTTFARIGLQLGNDLAVGIDRFGVTRAAPIDLDPGAVAGSGPAIGSFEQNQPLFALAAVGQGDVFATPIEMALVAATVANGGSMPSPHTAVEIRDASGKTVRRISPGPWRDSVLSPATAQELQQMMLAVVQRGTGTAAAISGVAVAGKTGTAQVPDAGPNAWFIGFAPAENPTVAIAVIVEQGGDLGSEATGGRVAAPIAREVMSVLLGR